MTSGLPPIEVPVIQSAHLTPPAVVRWSGVWEFMSHLPQAIPSRWSALIVAGVLPFVALYLAQPSAPILSSANEQLLTSYLSQELKQPLAQADTQPVTESATAPSATTPSPLPQPSESPVAAELAASQQAPVNNEQAFRYQLTLADGFLKKAVQLSRSTTGQQATVQEYLNQALDASHKAIDLDPRSGVGFLVRARIYATAAAVKPEFKTLSEQDLTIARALGITSASLDDSQNPLDFLPTQQATNMAGLPVVADAEEGNNTTVSTNQTGNLKQGVVVFAAGQGELIVSYPGLTANSVVTAKPVNTQNATSPFMVSKRETGVGFTLKALGVVTQDTEVAWSITEE